MQWTKLGHEKLSPQCWPRAVDTHSFSLTSFAYIRYFGALPIIHLACSPPVLREIVDNAYEFEGGEGGEQGEFYKLFSTLSAHPTLPTSSQL